MGSRRVVLFVRVAGRGFLGLGFFVEVVAESDAHFRRKGGGGRG